MKVTYVDHMGSDLSVVNAARVSFNKKSEWSHRLGEGKPMGASYPLVLSEDDEKLIKYLAKHSHWTPFGHTAVTLHIKAPLFVARQLGKHQVGLVWNEISRRYVDEEPEFYSLSGWRERAKNVKQGSSNTEITFLRMQGFGEQSINDGVFKHQIHSLDLYRDMLDAGVCPEQARMVLPQSMYTEWYWTGSIAAFSRVCNLRLDPHSQKETQEIARQISDVISTLFPVSWKELSND